eukprot:2947727-Alexandrium_andersonii.AAC.1
MCPTPTRRAAVSGAFKTLQDASRRFRAVPTTMPESVSSAWHCTLQFWAACINVVLGVRPWLFSDTRSEGRGVDASGCAQPGQD